MKQRKVVSMIGALVVIISAVVLITGCPQANSNKGNTGNNSGNISNNGGNTGNNSGNTGNNGGNNTGGNTGGGTNIVYTGSPLDEVVAKQDDENIYFYFSGGVWYQAGKYNGEWLKGIRGRYSGKILTSASNNTKFSCVIISNSLRMYSGEDATGPFLEYKIVTNVTDNIRNAELID